MDLKLNHNWFYISGIAFIVINSVAINLGFEWLGVLPIVFLILIIAVFRSDLLILLLSFLTPLSIEFENIGGGFGISLPDEPLLILLTGTVIFKYIIDGNYDYSVFKQPITIAILINLAWLIFDTFFSQLFLVSAKFVMSRMWYITTYYFLGVVLFKNIKNIHTFIWLHILGLLIVVFYSFYQHSKYDFSQIVSFTINQPFYVGHGVYAAALAFFIPYLILKTIYAFKLKITPWHLIINTLTLAIFTLGLILSYTRAGWVSSLASLVLLVLIWLKIKFRTIIIAILSIVIIIYINQDEIIYRLSLNKQNSSEGFDKHLESVSNINNDPSNLERVNRYVAALNMAKEKPIFGFGPGTYSFTYGVYQDPEFETPITTYFGDVGNCHSEYLGPLAESGWLGLITFLAILFYTYKIGLNIIYKTQNIEIKTIATSILVGLSSFLVHGLLNNYSETDKIAIILWSSLAIISALNNYHLKQPEKINHKT